MNSDCRTSLPITLRIWGSHAQFTRQELKVDRVSYDVITPSAACAIFGSIFWKPEISWSVRRIEVLAPVKTQTLTVNEVSAVAPVSGVGRTDVGIDVNAVRTQRTSTILRHVDYAVQACLTLRDDLLDDQMTKYVQMFYRRAGKGSYYNAPYLGTKEFPAEFTLVRDRSSVPPPVRQTRDLGLMLYSVFDREGNVSPAYFNAKMVEGVIEVPAPGTAGILR